MTVIVQSYNSGGIVSISAEFKEYLITFEPIYKHTSRITKPVRPFPYPGPMEEISKEIGINIKEMQTGQIAEWLE
ncbi:MAG: hypothetical protein QMD36_02360 [Candidatus Aenigmarchaeota archaeon]|nr:hypothetical protein [Candidatus Aenigmarchaeota archaeon]